MQKKASKSKTPATPRKPTQSQIKKQAAARIKVVLLQLKAIEAEMEVLSKEERQAIEELLFLQHGYRVGEMVVKHSGHMPGRYRVRGVKPWLDYDELRVMCLRFRADGTPSRLRREFDADELIRDSNQEGADR